MAEPARQLSSVPAAAEPAPQRRRVMLFADVLPSQPIARRRRGLVRQLADALVPVALLLAAAALWRL